MVSTDGQTYTEGYNIIPRHTLVAGYKNSNAPAHPLVQVSHKTNSVGFSMTVCAVGNVSGNRCESESRGREIESQPGPVLSWRLIMK